MASGQHETAVVLHRAPNLSKLRVRAMTGDSAQNVQAYLSAGGMVRAPVDLQGADAVLSVPVLQSVALINAHPHRKPG
jgi:hypothetical protein